MEGFQGRFGGEEGRPSREDVRDLLVLGFGVEGLRGYCGFGMWWLQRVGFRVLGGFGCRGFGGLKDLSKPQN